MGWGLFFVLCLFCLPAFLGSGAMVNAVFSRLTWRHGIKVDTSFPCSVEVGLAVGKVVGHSSVKSARMSSAVVLFLDQVEKVNWVIEAGITINDMFESVQPLSQSVTKIILSNGGREADAQAGRSCV